MVPGALGNPRCTVTSTSQSLTRYRTVKVTETSEGCCRETGSYEEEMQEEELVETVFNKSP